VATLSAASSTERFAGEVLVSGDPGYDEARALWNGDVDRRPKWIVRCEGVRDVVECVRVAREEELPLSVRSGGHGVGGHALVDDGLVVDLSAMRGIRVDPVRRTVRAQAGVLLGELDRECQAFRLATPAGIVTTTGLAGLTLGGGIGWLMRKHGATVDNLLSIDLVTSSATPTRTAGTSSAPTRTPSQTHPTS
jgi:FAD/FMN-containing dehydrogenase